jgi:hypothetical protein
MSAAAESSPRRSRAHLKRERNRQHHLHLARGFHSVGPATGLPVAKARMAETRASRGIAKPARGMTRVAQRSNPSPCVPVVQLIGSRLSWGSFLEHRRPLRFVHLTWIGELPQAWRCGMQCRETGVSKRGEPAPSGARAQAARPGAIQRWASRMRRSIGRGRTSWTRDPCYCFLSPVFLNTDSPRFGHRRWHQHMELLSLSWRR